MLLRPEQPRRKLGAGMATTLPSTGGMHVQEEKRSTFFQEALDGLLEFTGATAGWIGLVDPAGNLSFPARSGTFPESWLTLQQGQAKVWGFEVREGTVLLNDLPALPALGEPPLRNLLSCSLVRGP